jgi:N-acetylneuraminate synthase
MIKICKKIISYKAPVFVVAEAGVNHNGRLDLALKLIDAAAFAGADAVKFQTFRVEDVTTASAKMADYQKKNLGKEESQLEMGRKLQLAERHWPILIERAKKRGIVFFSTPHGHIASADYLQKLKVPAFKFGSGDITNLPLLEHVAKFKKPIILGTGMSDLETVKEAVTAIQKNGNRQIIVLHCTTDYPLAHENVNLLAMRTLMKESGALVGYSDHTLGSQVAVMATAMGACMIEKHLTLDKTLPGPDHIASMEPLEFQEMVKQIRKATTILGKPEKKLLACEKQYVPLVRKSLVASQKIKKGEKFNARNLTVKRPGTGILPKRFGEVLGKEATQTIPKDTLLTEEMIGFS